MSKTDWARLILLSILWGGSFLFVERLVAELPPLTIVLGRVAGGALTLAVILPLVGVAWPRGRAAWGALAGMGVLNNLIPFTLFVIAQGQITAGLAAILNATTPFFTLLALRLFQGDPLAGPRLAGVATGFAGVAVMLGGGAGGTAVAIALCLGAATSYGLAGVWGQRFRQLGVQPLQAAFGQTACSALMLLPLVLLVDRPWQLANPSAGAWMALAGLAVFSTSLAYLLYFRIMASAGAVALSLVTLLIPVSALGIGGLLHSRLPEPQHLAGMALIGLGLGLLEWGRRRALATTTRP